MNKNSCTILGKRHRTTITSQQQDQMPIPVPVENDDKDTTCIIIGEFEDEEVGGEVGGETVKRKRQKGHKNSRSLGINNLKNNKSSSSGGIGQLKLFPNTRQAITTTTAAAAASATGSPTRKTSQNNHHRKTRVHTEFSSEIKVIRDVSCVSVIRLVRGEDKFQPWAMNILEEIACRVPTNSTVPKIRHSYSPYGQISKLFGNLRVKDFCDDICLRNLRESAMEFEIIGTDEKSRCALSYMRGLLTRKGEVAIVPLPDTRYQLLLFNHEDQLSKAPIDNSTVSPDETSVHSKPSPDLDNVSDSDSGDELFDSEFVKGMQSVNFVTSLRAILVERFTIVFDLDDTLIKSWIVSPDTQQEMTRRIKIMGCTAYPMEIMGQKYMCAVRPGSDQLLRWASSVWNVQFFTNAIWEYGKEVLKILDPQREHILQHIDPDGNDDAKSSKHLSKILKSREVMRQVDYLPKPLGLKELDRWGIDLTTSVALDDDEGVWGKSSQNNLLDFEQVTGGNGKAMQPRDFFLNVREASWDKIRQLQLSKYKARISQQRPKIDKEKHRTIIPSQIVTLSQELVTNQAG